MSELAKSTGAIAGMDYEDKNRHRGVRHPRTAITLTEDWDLLLITVDGCRSGQSEGMNAKELTGFIVKYFSPQYALNMDGGGI
ncbi:phosphodiester glycosidase family protein [uncultured Bacteroides sp.]|mgnify:FL=1|nr:phosphodiester glycosidase family protein [uncultured Bacteroides sp.]